MPILDLSEAWKIMDRNVLNGKVKEFAEDSQTDIL
jgi:hypothetical protein